jgi:tRNA nucleotidyltransferase/poly(A) polymerase
MKDYLHLPVELRPTILMRQIGVQHYTEEKENVNDNDENLSKLTDDIWRASENMKKTIQDLAEMISKLTNNSYKKKQQEKAEELIETSNKTQDLIIEMLNNAHEEDKKAEYSEEEYAEDEFSEFEE